jgi:ribose transport system permease protein
MNLKMIKIGNYGLIITFIVICIFISIMSPKFLLPQNIRNIMIQISINALLATGMSFVILTGGIDIGVGSVAALSGVLVAGLCKLFPELSGLSFVIIGLIGSIVIGLACGGFNALFITRFNVHPFIATLGMLSIARGFAYVYTGGKPVFGLPESFGWLGQGYIGPIPVLVLIIIIILSLAHIFLDKTVLGRYVYAVGSNEEVAKLNGIKVSQIKFMVYIISGFLSAFAGVCLSSKLISGQPMIGSGYELNAIAATVMGGISMSGGKGNIGNTIMGLLTIGVINNGMSLIGVSSYWQTIVMGFIIVVAVAVDQHKQK